MSSKNPNSPNQPRNRIRLFEAASILVCLAFTAGFGAKYVVMPEIRETSRSTKNTITYNEIRNKVVEGDIFDRNGNLIMGNASEGVAAFAYEPEAYSYAWLLGYYSVNSSTENKFGLRGNLSRYSLFTLDDQNKGAAVNLTTDSDLQNLAYSLLNGEEGSITVIDNKSGAVLCFTSRSTISYNVNDVNDLLESDVEGAQFRRGTFENDPPGSTFKVITAAAALQKAEDEELGEDWFRFYDTGTYIPEGSDYSIKNYNDKVYGEIGLETGLNYSVNCYFADLGIRVGSEALAETAKKFMFGKPIEIPFLCTLNSSMEFADSEPITVAQTSFGQGLTQVTPFQLAMVAQAVANNGRMMQPYIVRSVFSGSIPLYYHIDRKLTTSLSQSVDNQLKKIMHSTAEVYGLDEESFGYVCAKTGTAECANDRIHTYMIGFTEDASFCISMNNARTSKDIYPIARQLILGINQAYEN